MISSTLMEERSDRDICLYEDFSGVPQRDSCRPARPAFRKGRDDSESPSLMTSSSSTAGMLWPTRRNLKKGKKKNDWVWSLTWYGDQSLCVCVCVCLREALCTWPTGDRLSRRLVWSHSRPLMGWSPSAWHSPPDWRGKTEKNTCQNKLWGVLYKSIHVHDSAWQVEANSKQSRLLSSTGLFSLLPEASCFKEVLTEGFAACFGHFIIRRGHELWT